MALLPFFARLVKSIFSHTNATGLILARYDSLFDVYQKLF